MYIIKNALKCIGRSKGRNVLIGVIVLVIATAACVGLSIRQAAESTREDTLAGLTVTATISYDTKSVMNGFMDNQSSQEGGRPSFDRDQFASMRGETESLTLEEYQKYAAASSVKDFYYSMTVNVNGSENFEPVSSSSEETDDTTDTSTESENGGNGGQGGFGGGGFGGMFGGMNMNFLAADFQITGYSGDNAMTSFVDGTASITDGKVFTEGGTELECIISSVLATYNELIVGDTVTITNPDADDETYALKIVGIYTATSSEESSSFTMGGMTSSDPDNRIYMSYAALDSILKASERVSETVTDDNGRESETKMTGNLSAKYVFSTIEDYEKFEEEVRTLGLDESYKVSSNDLSSYENSLLPLETLSTMAGWFLIVILVIGAIILVVLNIFNVRERKYEIGVLTAMGMKKGKVAMQFLTEIFIVTIIAVIIGGSIGAVSSVPVTNALLANQVESQNSQSAQIDTNFGRENGGMPDMPGGMSQMPDGGSDGKNPFANMFGGDAENNYVTEISSAMNLTVVFQLLGIAVLLTLVAGAVSMLFVMRYEPLKILANRD